VEVWEALQERGKGDLTLHPGERRAETMVNAAPPEGQVSVGLAGQIQVPGFVEVPLVAVGRTEDPESELTAGDPGAGDLEILAGVALGRNLDGRG
jgi:hypothetical protein